MIKIILGNVGSGKTAFAVREMAINYSNRKTFSNIITKLKNQVDINASMILSREIADYKKNRKTGQEEPVYKYSLNMDFWKDIIKKNKSINVIIDEAHSIINSRRAMSKVNIIITDWLALIRRILGQAESGAGELTFITQLPNRIDNIARDMATNVIYVICHYYKSCRRCGITWNENSEMPEPYYRCPLCYDLDIVKHSHFLEVWHFRNMEYYAYWRDLNQKTFYKHYVIDDIEKYFHLYSTMQWDNLFSAYY